MGTESPLPLGTERSLEEAAENGRLDELPVVPRRLAEELHLLGLELHARRICEQAAVGPRDVRVHAARGRAGLRLGEVAEELAQVVHARPLGRLQKLIEDGRKAAAGDHSEVLREHAPNRLEHEVAAPVGIRLAPLLEAAVDLGDAENGLPREFRAVLVEAGLEPSQEAERL